MDISYMNENHCNILPKEAFEGLAHEVFDVIAQNMAKSLGPLGSSATILQGSITSATKDGYTILKNYRFHNRYKRMIYNLFLAPCTKMNNTVGDATTTAIVLTNALYNRYAKQKYALGTLYRLPRQFTQAWDEVVTSVTSRVKKYATPLNASSYQDVFNIAYVTSNGNVEVSDAIAQVYQESESPAIKMMDSPTNKSYIVPIKGYDFPANLISDVFAKNEDKSTVEANPAVMIFDHKIETDTFDQVIGPINDIMRARGHKLIIVAPFFDSHMLETTVQKYLLREKQQYQSYNLLMVQYVMGDLKKNQLTDLAAVLRAQTISQDRVQMILSAKEKAGNMDAIVEDMLEKEDSDLYRFIGRAAEASMSCLRGSIFKADHIEDDEEYQRTLTSARKDLADITATNSMELQSYSAKIYDAKERLNQLLMDNYVYYVGADSMLQKQILHDAIEDVIKCLRSATKNGVVAGCQLSLIRACTEYSNELGELKTPADEQEAKLISLRLMIADLIRGACVDVYLQIIHGPDGNGMVKLLPRWEFTKDEGVDALKKEALDKGDKIIMESLERNEVFDMERLDYNPGIVTSAETDVMVLLAATELVKILTSGNQCIMLDQDIDESHEETKEYYA